MSNSTSSSMIWLNSCSAENSVNVPDVPIWTKPAKLCWIINVIKHVGSAFLKNQMEKNAINKKIDNHVCSVHPCIKHGIIWENYMLKIHFKSLLSLQLTEQAWNSTKTCLRSPFFLSQQNNLFCLSEYMLCEFFLFLYLRTRQQNSPWDQFLFTKAEIGVTQWRRVQFSFIYL